MCHASQTAQLASETGVLGERAAHTASSLRADVAERDSHIARLTAELEAARQAHDTAVAAVTAMQRELNARASRERQLVDDLAALRYQLAQVREQALFDRQQLQVANRRLQGEAQRKATIAFDGNAECVWVELL